MTLCESNRVVFSGSSWIEEAENDLFIPRLNNAYEQQLFEEVLSKTGIEYWYIKRFAKSSSLPHMQAMEKAFDAAIKDAGLLRKIKKKNSSRCGVIYFDHYGPISFMERSPQIKEMYYSDVFPSILLQNHNISGLSFRYRCERNAPMQAINLAKNLIEGGELDIVLVGGINPCYSFFFLSEQLETRKWERQQGMRHAPLPSTRYLSEAAGFLVLESETHARSRGREELHCIGHIDTQRESYAVSGAVDNPLVQAWEGLSSRFDIQKAHFGLYPTPLIENIEAMLLDDCLSNVEKIRYSQGHSDASSLNLVRILHDFIHDEKVGESSTLIHSADRGGFGWNLLTH